MPTMKITIKPMAKSAMYKGHCVFGFLGLDVLSNSVDNVELLSMDSVVNRSVVEGVVVVSFEVSFFGAN